MAGGSAIVGSIPTISRNNYLGGEMTERFNLFEGNCLEVMATMAENSIDSIVTDPPYELGFMGKSWDSSGVAFNIEVWQEALRVLKPGGHLLAFSGSRTYHRMAVAIEDAGFEIRDQIMWIYGSGFPKSHNIAKAIQKADGVEPIGFKENENAAFYGTGSGGQYNLTPRQLFMPPTEGTAAEWDGWGTALKPAHEPIVVARKPLIGTVANNVLTFGTGGLNIDGARVGSDEMTEGRATPSGSGAYNWNLEKGDAPKLENPATHTGRWPANVIHDGSDEVVELFPDTKSGAVKPYVRNKESVNVDFLQGTEQVEKSFDYADSGSAARFFYCAKASKKDRNEGLDGFEAKQINVRKGDENAVFTPNNVSAKNHHPTVKPTSLMQYLVRLVTPPNGIVLDPFLGSGSTGKAAMYEGFNFIGIELTPEYLPIAKARIEFALQNKELELDFGTP